MKDEHNPKFWQMRIVKTGPNCFEALGYYKGVCQGSYGFSNSEDSCRRVIAQKFPKIKII